MTPTDIYKEILDGSHQLINRELRYLKGTTSIKITKIGDNTIYAERGNKKITIPLAAAEELATALAGGNPIHVDTLFHGRGNYRSSLEAIIAHLPKAGYLPANSPKNRGAKKVLWFSHDIHPLGEFLDATEIFDIDKIWEREAVTCYRDGLIIKALLTKPFLILSGPSGTGKTRGALELAEAICEQDAYAVVAVGADWTDNRHVLGYLNPLETVDAEGSRSPIYETTPILDLIVRAIDHPFEPHVLILDEMNLSHVERYFADFLSAMELENKENALKLHTAAAALSRAGVEIPGSIDFPSNLFVIGTVNIDETTYMFSPKVLDRANVIEIHAEATAMENFLNGTQTTDAAAEAKDHGISFLDAALVIQSDEEHDKMPYLPKEIREAAAKHLMELFHIMKRGRSEFGFRTGKEVMAYLRTAYFLTGTDAPDRAAWEEGIWQEALDAQILQKILPKLHGSRSRLAPLLGALATYCGTGEETYALEHFSETSYAAKRTLKDAQGISNPKFKSSYAKLERMIDILIEEQFVSFIC